MCMTSRSRREIVLCEMHQMGLRTKGSRLPTAQGKRRGSGDEAMACLQQLSFHTLHPLENCSKLINDTLYYCSLQAACSLSYTSPRTDLILSPPSLVLALRRAPRAHPGTLSHATSFFPCCGICSVSLPRATAAPARVLTMLSPCRTTSLLICFAVLSLSSHFSLYSDNGYALHSCKTPWEKLMQVLVQLTRGKRLRGREKLRHGRQLL